MQTLAKGLAKARLRSAVPAAAEGHARPTPIGLTEPPTFDVATVKSVEPDPRTLAENRVIVDGTSPASAAYKMLRTRVLQRMRRNGWQSIAVTGTCPGEGKSLTALNLSISLARDVGTSVVLADLDFRKPSLHRHLGLSLRHGLGDYLRGAVGLDHVAVSPGVERLAVLLNERSYSGSSEMLASPQAASLVKRVAHGAGRIAVFDLPPVLASDDMLAFAPLVDAVLVVVAQGTTRHDDLVAARDMLQNVNIVGVVLNRSSELVAPYYYYGGYGGAGR
jgi:Mrp family chromosome partitioning ATPase